MGVCQICGASYGILSGGEEVYTGASLKVCNGCNIKLCDIENAMMNEKGEECIDLANELLNTCINDDTKIILNSYLQRYLEKYKTIEERRRNEEIQKQKTEEIEKKFLELKKNFKLTTGYIFDGYEIAEYLGIYSGEVVLGTGFVSEFSASLSDIMGSRSNTFAKKMSAAKQGALQNLMKNALVAGANALIGIDFDYVTFENNIMGVSANGTAVIIKKEEK